MDWPLGDQAIGPGRAPATGGGALPIIPPFRSQTIRFPSNQAASLKPSGEMTPAPRG